MTGAISLANQNGLTLAGEGTGRLILSFFRPSLVSFSGVLADLVLLVLVGVAADWFGSACKHGNTTKD